MKTKSINQPQDSNILGQLWIKEQVRLKTTYARELIEINAYVTFGLLNAEQDEKINSKNKIILQLKHFNLKTLHEKHWWNSLFFK